MAVLPAADHFLSAGFPVLAGIVNITRPSCCNNGHLFTNLTGDSSRIFGELFSDLLEREAFSQELLERDPLRIGKKLRYGSPPFILPAQVRG